MCVFELFLLIELAFLKKGGVVVVCRSAFEVRRLGQSSVFELVNCMMSFKTKAFFFPTENRPATDTFTWYEPQYFLMYIADLISYLERTCFFCCLFILSVLVVFHALRPKARSLLEQ